MVDAVALPLLIGDVHGDGTAAEEHPHVAVLWKERRQGKTRRDGGQAADRVEETER